VADADSNHRSNKRQKSEMLHKIRTEKQKHLVQILEAVPIQLQNNTDKTEQNAQINEKI